MTAPGSGDLLFRLRVVDDSGQVIGQFKAKMAGLEQGFSSANTRTVAFSRGLALAQRGLESFAIQAVGLQGGLGALSRGLLMVGLGSTPVLAALGAAAALSVAYDKLRGASKAAREEEEKRAQSLERAAAATRRGAEAAEGAAFLLGGTRGPTAGGRLVNVPSVLRQRPTGGGPRFPGLRGIAPPEGQAEWAEWLLGGRAPGDRGGVDPAFWARMAHTANQAAFVTMVGQRGMVGARPPGLRGPADLGASFQRDLARNQTFQSARLAGLGPLGRLGGLFRGGGLSGQDLALGGISAIQGAMAGGGGGGLLSGGLSLAGTAAFGPIGGALGGLLASALGGLFKRGPSQQELQLREAQKTNALLQQQLKVMEDEKNFRGSVTLRADTFDPSDASSLERLAEALRSLSDRRVEVEGRRR